MTNAEFLARDTHKLAQIILASTRNGCATCPAYGLGLCQSCHSIEEVEVWLRDNISPEIC